MYVRVCVFVKETSRIMKLNFQHQLWTANDVYNSTVACLFASLQHFYYALKIILPWRNQITRLSVSIETPRHIYHFSMIFIFFCRVVGTSSNFSAWKNVDLSTLPLLPLQHAITHQHFHFLNSQFPSYLHLYITLCCPHHVNIIHSKYSACHCNFTQIYVDRHFVYLFEKSFWIGNSLSHLQCCLMQLLLLG